MKKYVALLAMTLAMLCWSLDSVSARGGRGGGGGGARGGGGGMARGGGGGGMSRAPAARTPSMSRPQSRPQPSRPQGGGYGNRPSGANRPTTRPSTGMGNLPSPGRPGSGVAQRPSTGNRPTTGNRPGAGTLPSVGTRPGAGGAGRPSRDQLNNFVDLGGGAGAARPGGRPSTLPGGAGGAAHDFFNSGSGAGRPSTLPARPGEGGLAGADRPTTRPGQGGAGTQRPGAGGANRPGNRPGAGNRPGIDNRPGTRPGGDRWSHTPDRINNWQDHHAWQNNRWDNINDHWRDNWHDRYHDHFDGDWCHHHPFWHCHDDFNYWGVATWGVAAAWLPWGWTEPQYYNYGQNVYYQDDQVYYGSTPVASAADYAAQAEAIATSVPETPPADDSWMSLGVFAVTSDKEQSGADPTMFLQLVVSKEGVIAGTLQNTVSGTTKNIEGMVDKASYRAAWTVVGETRPLMECGFSNLTDNTVPTLVHYEDGTTQQWLLVRMEQPPETKQPATVPSGALPPQ